MKHRTRAASICRRILELERRLFALDTNGCRRGHADVLFRKLVILMLLLTREVSQGAATPEQVCVLRLARWYVLAEIREAQACSCEICIKLFDWIAVTLQRSKVPDLQLAPSVLDEPK